MTLLFLALWLQMDMQSFFIGFFAGIMLILAIALAPKEKLPSRFWRPYDETRKPLISPAILSLPSWEES